ncbi:MAG: phenylacetate--CoA ligase [Candidatus Omnitrophica bacterium]|nr:phenylacetate--CoA ligase [Candidatus Omnitrophota bacterium]MCM8769941.1 phenylacetate--CoA ligase [Candidatus Omnitrophota bacterium]
MKNIVYFEERTETLTEKELKELQLERLQRIAAYVQQKVPFYQQAFAANHIDAAKISTLDDLRYLPLTSKSALRDHYPFGLFAIPLTQVMELHASSGTTGKMTVVGYSSADIKLWSTVMARSLACGGVKKGDIIHNAYGYGLFTGGLGVHYGALELGVTVVPSSVGQTKRQIDLLADFKSTVLTCTPSYSLYMAEEARNYGFDPLGFSLRIGVFGAEPWSEGMRKQIEKEWGLQALDIYGLSEIIGPGVAMECPGQEGLHVWADHFLPEVIDPKSGEPLEEGQEGELVITTLTKEALPLIRYRTGDIVTLTTDRCPHCHRTMPRISKILGRIDDMLIIRGINVFPSQIESVLMKIPEVSPHYQLVVTREHHLDKLEVQVEVSSEVFSDEVKKLEELQQRVLAEIENTLGISVAVKLVEPKSIERSQGKAKRVIDQRQI